MLKLCFLCYNLKLFNFEYQLIILEKNCVLLQLWPIPIFLCVGLINIVISFNCGLSTGSGKILVTAMKTK